MEPLKQKLEDLVIFGGRPAFGEPLHVGRPNIGNRDRLRERFEAILDSRRLTNDGPMVQEFERRIGQEVGAKHVVAMCNATIALEIAIRAMGLKGEVIVPSFTFIATAHALKWQQITPVFCDVDEYGLIDPQDAARRITSRTTGIIGVHLWGRICDVEALRHLADQHNLGLMFDAAHAFGCSSPAGRVGTFGDAEVFSFHATKFLNSFEGGAIVTRDQALAGRMRFMRNFGFANLDRVDHIGTNGKMPEISAAMGLTSLESMQEWISCNRGHHEAYARALKDIPGLEILDYPAGTQSNYQYVVLKLDAEKFGMTRDELLNVLYSENVLARRYFYPGCHRQWPYLSEGVVRLPKTEQLGDLVLQLPTGTTVDSAIIQKICSLIRLASRHARQIRTVLPNCRPATGWWV